jgi:hypothetical protein
MKRNKLITTALAAALLAAAMGILSQPVHGGVTISLSGPGAGGGGTIICGQPVTFSVHFNNNTGTSVSASTNGFRLYSPDGATWAAPVCQSTGALEPYYEGGVYISKFSVDGISDDTVGFGGFSNIPPHLPVGFNDSVLTISTAVSCAMAGKTLCIDSTWYRPSNDWLWAWPGGSVVPEWGGPYCFPIQEQPDFYMKDCFEDDGTVPSWPKPAYHCGNYWGADDALCINMSEPHLLAPGLWNRLSMRVYNRTLATSGPARVFAYYQPYAAGFDWPGEPPPPGGVIQRLWDDEKGFNEAVYGIPNFGEKRHYVQKDVMGGAVGEEYAWHWFFPEYADPDVSHYCLGWVIHPVNEPDGNPSSVDPQTSPKPWLDNNVAQINMKQLIAHSLIKGALDSEHPNGQSKAALSPPTPIFQTHMRAYNSTGANDVFYLNMDTNSMNPGYPLWYAEWSPQGYVPIYADSFVTVELSIYTDDSASHGDSGVVTFLLAPAYDTTQVIGGCQISFRIDNNAPHSGINLDWLCTDDMPNCCPEWLIPVCDMMTDYVPLEWDIPTLDDANLPEVLQFFYVYRDTVPALEAGDVYDSVAVDLDLDEPRFQYVDPRVDSCQVYYYAVAAVDGAGNVSEISNEIQVKHCACCNHDGIRGDVNMSGTINVGDVTYLVAYLTQKPPGSPAPPCFEEGDVNGSGTINVGDVTYLVSYLKQKPPGSPPPPACGSAAGAPAAGKVRNDMSLNTSCENGMTLISLESSVGVRGIQIELVGTQTGEPVKLVDDRMELFVNQRTDGTARVLILDLEGDVLIEKGAQALVRLPGEFKIIEAVVSDFENHEVTPAINATAKNTTLPNRFVLYQNHPNPFNPTTEISFDLPNAANAKLEIYNIMGQRVATLVDRFTEAGTHSVTWNSTDDQGHQVASGIYFYRLDAGAFVDTKKMVLLK